MREAACTVVPRTTLSRVELSGAAATVSLRTHAMIAF